MCVYRYTCLACFLLGRSSVGVVSCCIVAGTSGSVGGAL